MYTALVFLVESLGEKYMLKKTMVACFLLGGCSLSMANGLGDNIALSKLCNQLSVDIIDFSNHQTDGECQGVLGEAGTFVDAAGGRLAHNQTAQAKSDLTIADQAFSSLSSAHCAEPVKLASLQARERSIMQQIKL